jgi:hypothetical protein
MRLTLILVLAAAACAAPGPETARLEQIFRATGDARARELARAFAKSDARLAALDSASQRALATPAQAGVPTRFDAAYDAAVRERRKLLDSALDVLYPPAAHLPSGAILELDNAIAGRAAALLGMYAPAEFKRRIGGGIYLTEPFDPRRDVLLVVHGINGSPVDFRELIRAVDATRYQVWMAYYPTGDLIPAMARFVRTALAAQLARAPARRVFVLCHSLGGLVFRTMLARDGFPGRLAAVTYASTPQRGVHFTPMAAVKLACRWLWRVLPAEIDDLLEGSDYLAALNALPLPPGRVRTAGGRSWHTLNARVVGPLIAGEDDGLVPLANVPLAGTLSHQVFAQDHYTILSSPEFQAAFNRWLAADDAATR